jgi:hypothetical protein
MEFRSWRIAARNVIDHQRRGSRWWRGVSLHCWLGQDGRVRGVVSLHAITKAEFEEATRRWGPTFRRIAEEELADEVYAALRPDIVAEGDGGGYQTIRFTVRPQRTIRAVRQPLGPRQVALIEPMPLLL